MKQKDCCNTFRLDPVYKWADEVAHRSLIDEWTQLNEIAEGCQAEWESVKVPNERMPVAMWLAGYNFAISRILYFIDEGLDLVS